MAYQRRYFPALTITTISYGEKSVTTDKLADKAVTQPKVADDAITSDKIEDESILSEDIKAGEVKTSDIASGAVTTDKIADQAVTTDKLEASIQGIARPLTPGVATVEIADSAVTEGKLAANSVATAKIKDGNVNAAKLAADAVETVKVKDGAITTAKIAGGAIDATKIGVGAVTGSEIQNGAVSASELAANAVEAAKVKDLNITEPKLAEAALSKRIISRYLVENSFFFDNFDGKVLKDPWEMAGDAGWINGTDNSELLLRPKNVTGSACRATFGGNTGLTLTLLKPIFISQVRHSDLTYLTTIIGMYKDANNYIVFKAEDLVGATPTWHIITRAGGVSSDVDSLVSIKTSPRQLLEIAYVDDTHVRFYIDGVLIDELITNIPTDKAIEPYLYHKANLNDYRYLYVSYVGISGLRNTFGE